MVEKKGREVSPYLQEGQSEAPGSQSPAPRGLPSVLSQGALWKGCHTKVTYTVLALEVMASRNSGKACPLYFHLGSLETKNFVVF